MAISKVEATKKARFLKESDLKRHEEIIDAALSDPTNGPRILISSKQVPSHLWRVIEDRYRAKGWKVTWQSDYRDGDFWVFE